jgi:co-chaperonin GroES (HSP10)
MSAEVVTGSAGAGEVPAMEPAVVAPPPRIEPLFDRLLVLQKEEKTHERGIEIAERYREQPTEGRVLAVGGTCTIAVGATVLFHLFAGVKLPADYGKNLVMLAQGELIAILHRDE